MPTNPCLLVPRQVRLAREYFSAAIISADTSKSSSAYRARVRSAPHPGARRQGVRLYYCFPQMTVIKTFPR